MLLIKKENIYLKVIEVLVNIIIKDFFSFLMLNNI